MPEQVCFQKVDISDVNLKYYKCMLKKFVNKPLTSQYVMNYDILIQESLMSKKHSFKAVLFSCLALFSLTACNADVETEVSLKDLYDKTVQSKMITGKISIDVGSCTDFQDKNKESDSLTQAKDSVAKIFQGSQFLQCSEADFKSLADFNIPISIDKSNNDTRVSDSALTILSNDFYFLAVEIPQNMAQSINEFTQSNFMLQDMEMNVSIKIVNDMDKDMLFDFIATYLNDEPYVYNSETIKAKQNFTLKLSDVSVDMAMDGFTSPVLFYNESVE